MDGEVLVRIAVEVGCGFAWGDPRSEVPQTPENYAAWVILEEEFAAAPGMYDIPFEVPAFDLYDDNMLKHMQGKHDQSRHGSWATGPMAGTPELAAKQAAIAAAPRWKLDGAVASISSMQDLYYRDEEEFVRRHMADTLEALTQDGEGRGLDRSSALSEAMDTLISDSTMMRIALERELARLSTRLYDEVGKAWNHKGDGWESQASPNVVIESDGTIQVEGVIYDEKNQLVGEWVRTIYPPGVASMFKEDVNEASVYHDSFVMDDRGAGRGIGKKFLDHLDNLYIANGVSSVGVTAVDLSYGDPSKPGGSSVWASLGFDFLKKSSAEAVVGSLKYYTKGAEYRDLPKPIRAAVDDVLYRFENAEFGGEFPTPREVWMLGRLPGSAWWPGKSIMGHSGEVESAADGQSGPSWFGVKRYKAEGLRMTEAEVRHEEVLRRVDRVARDQALRQAIAAHRAKAGYGEMPDGFIMIDGQPVPLAAGDVDIAEALGAFDD